MKTPVTLSALLAICAMSLPLMAQDDAPMQAPPPPDNGNYDIPQDQAPPPPDQQGGPDQQQQDTGPQNGPDQGSPDQPASFQTFYDNLGQQGSWIQSPDYGYVWQPTVNDPSWAPYTDGHWVYTDAGWTWASDEPWGWATYHYGRWVNLDGTGWCWVPGYTWAPAWVSWRYGAGYCGWAPLPPESFVGIDYIGSGIQISAGFHIGGDCDSYYGIGAGCYHFVPVTYIGYSNYRGHYANPHNNYAIINRTTNVTNLNVNRNGGNNWHGGRRGFNGVTTGGPSLAQVNAVSQTPVQQVRLTQASRPDGGGRIDHNSMALYAPRVAPGANGQPTHVNQSLGRTTVNRGTDVTKPLAVNRNLSEPPPTQSQVQAAQLAQFNAPPHARVVTPNAQVNPALQAPVTTMQPIATPSASRMQGGAVNDPGNQTFTQQQHPAFSSPNGGNNSHAANSQGKSFYQITHPNQGAGATDSTVRAQASPAIQPQAAASPNVVTHNANNAPQNNPFVQQRQTAPNVVTSPNQPQATSPQAQAEPQVFHQNHNNSPQGNPYFQQRQAAPDAAASPVHPQATPTQTQSTPQFVHHNENNNMQRSVQPVQQPQPAATPQSQASPAPSNPQSQSFPSPANNQGGNGGPNHQHNH